MKPISLLPENKAAVFKKKNKSFVVTSDTSEINIKDLFEKLGDRIEIVFKPNEYIQSIIDRSNDSDLFVLEQLYSAVSSYSPITILAMTMIMFLVVIIPFFIFSNKDYSLLMSVILLSLLPIILSFYKIGLFIMRIFYVKDQAFEYNSEVNLPIYTVLIPMYKENEVTISNLLHSLKQIVYDKSKLDVIFLLETNDTKTKAVMEKYQLSDYMQVLTTPDAKLLTKPRACNYGLSIARGEFLTIYDAEDVPDPYQLVKAVKMFRESEEKVVCLQCKLRYHNSTENWITKLFSLEYLTWFDFVLPIIAKLNLPIPLGGTSNHFKTDFLKSVGGWDAHNVTEDAALGILIYMLGYKVLVLDSFTLEEANCRFVNWVKQRTRWIKGHIKTYLIYCGDLNFLYKKLGFWKFIHFHLFFGVGSTTSLFFLVCLMVTVFSLVIDHSLFRIDTPIIRDLFLLFTIFSLSIYLINILLGLYVAIKKKEKKLIASNLLMPIYHFMSSISGARAYWQLIFNPMHWEKTEHGISKSLTIKKQEAEIY